MKLFNKYGLAETPENVQVKTKPRPITGLGPQAEKKTAKSRYCRCVWYLD